MTVGYSGTPLLKKLGIKPAMKIVLVNAPAAYTTWLESDISSQLCKAGETPDLIHLFAKSKAVFEQEIKQWKSVYTRHPQLVIWVSWYKKAAGIPTDLTEDLIRDYALKNGLVDVKVCAVSNEWSGLKLVVPLAKR